MKNQVTLPPLLPWQQEVLSDPHKYKVISAGTKTGITRLGITAALQTFLAGGIVWIVGWDTRTTTQAWRLLQKITRQIPDISIEKNLHKVSFNDENYIQVRHITHVDLAEDLDLLVLDHAAQITQLEWESIFLPSLLSRHGTAYIMSIPAGRNFFYRLHQRELDPTIYSSWKSWTILPTQNPYSTQESIEAKAQTPSLLYQQRYEGAFLDISATGTLFAEYRTPEGIVKFAEDIVGVKLAPYQKEILAAIVEYHRVAIRGPRGLGKTTIGAIFILWLVACQEVDTKVLTTAGSWRQLAKFLWPEVRKWGRRADWSKLGLVIRVGKELLDLSITVGDKTAFAAATDDAAMLEGAHATTVGAVFDEAKAIPENVFDSVEGSFSSGEIYALMLSTPGPKIGRFYDVHAKKPGFEEWWTRHVTLEECVAAGRITEKWVKGRKRAWGETSPLFQAHVLGEFSDDLENTVIPLQWVEQANQRWLQWKAENPDYDEKLEPITFGVDPARVGDRTAIARLQNNILLDIERRGKGSLMALVGYLVTSCRKNIDNLAVDIGGMGVGVIDRLDELEYNPVAVNFGSSTKITDDSGQQKYVNLRAAMYFMLRDALDPDGDIKLMLPVDDILSADLVATTYMYNSKGQIKLEEKQELKDRLGRSPDSADALAIAIWAQGAISMWEPIIAEEYVSEEEKVTENNSLGYDFWGAI